MTGMFDRRDFLLHAASVSLLGGLLAACAKHSGVGELPVLRVSTVGKGEADMRLLQATANIRKADAVLSDSSHSSAEMNLSIRSSSNALPISSPADELTD
jgi:hypothetical protein